MVQISTLNQILLFHYNELSYPEKVEMATILSLEEEVRSEYKEIKASIYSLPKAGFLPTPESIHKILEYSSFSRSV